MKNLLSINLMTVVLLSGAVTAGCAAQQAHDSASKATPEARQAIKNASDAISMANANNWIWSDTEDLLTQAQAAADSGDNAKAVQLANQAKAQAEAAIIQYNYEKDHPRGM
jgi:hypothetical protein